MSYYTGRDISTKLFEYTGDDFCRLRSNYARSIAKRANTDTDLQSVFHDVFGREWHKEPYSRLYQLAKIASKGRVNKAYQNSKNPMETIHTTSSDIERYKEAMESSVYVRYVKKITNKDERKKLGDRATKPMYAKQIVLIDKIIERYCPETLSDYRKNVKRVCSDISMGELRNIVYCPILTNDMKRELIKLRIEILSDENLDQQIVKMSGRQLSNLCCLLGNAACQVSYWGKISDDYIKAITKRVMEVRETAEMGELMKQLNVEISHDYVNYHHSRVSKATLKALRMASKQSEENRVSTINTLWQLTRVIQCDNHNRRVFAPTLYSK